MNIEPSSAQAGPALEYARRLDLRTAEASRLDARHRGIGLLRLAVFTALLVVAWMSFRSRVLSPWWLSAPAVAFVALMAWQDRVLRAKQIKDRGADFYRRGLARLDGSWPGTGDAGDRFRDPGHPYTEDLDIFGPGSLFELLCTARTAVGRETVAAWLRVPAGAAAIPARQEAVRELAPRIDLRESLAVSGTGIASELHPASLSGWSRAPSHLWPRGVRPAATLLAAAALVTLAVWIVTEVQLWFFLVVLLELIFFAAVRRRVRSVTQEVEQPGRELGLLSDVLAIIERQRFETGRLQEVRALLDSGGAPASRRIRSLHRRIVLLDSRRNMIFAPVAAMLLWEVHLAYSVEAWRRRHGASVPRWVDAAGEVEALCALSEYAHERPEDPFPQIEPEGTLFSGIGLGHPLIPAQRCVRNDVRLGSDLRVLVVSGSNMSGKSTLLRTVGVNAVLALAGAPVCARELRLSVLNVGASIRVMDSLQGGSSRFYAEITRLRLLFDVLQEKHGLLFLLDELLHGTNSHDRRIGGEGVVRGLVDKGAMGLLTTHDLALAHIAEVLAPLAENAHFEDHIEDGKITFDYRLRPGIVRKSNALELMRSVGLEV